MTVDKFSITTQDKVTRNYKYPDLKLYTYRNDTNPDEKYIQIFVNGTFCLKSYVTLKPANIPDAPVMEVNTYMFKGYIDLPQSVDEWEIKYYSRSFKKPSLTPKYLKNKGIVNLKKELGKYIPDGLHLELSGGQFFGTSAVFPTARWNIPGVKK